MRQEDVELAKRYPLLLAEMLSPPEQQARNSPLKCFGLECGPGWLPLLTGLFETLEEMISAQPEQERARYRAVQIKEKFGGLRLYLSGSTEPMREAINTAEAASTTICAICSAPGQLHAMKSGWMATRCEAHRETRG